MQTISTIFHTRQKFEIDSSKNYSTLCLSSSHNQSYSDAKKATAHDWLLVDAHIKYIKIFL